MREAPALTLIEALLAAGALVTVHDPVAMDEGRRRLGGSVTFAPSNYDALSDADALVVVTDWNEYRHPDFARIRQALRRPIIVDGRNLYSLERMAEFGFAYYSLGRPAVV
jgi:UDPglucose 6-dehydrogenase